MFGRLKRILPLIALLAVAPVVSSAEAQAVVRRTIVSRVHVLPMDREVMLRDRGPPIPIRAPDWIRSASR